MPEYASNAKGNAALTTGIIGTALGGINAIGGLGALGGLFGNNRQQQAAPVPPPPPFGAFSPEPGDRPVTRYEMGLWQRINEQGDAMNRQRMDLLNDMSNQKVDYVEKLSNQKVDSNALLINQKVDLLHDLTRKNDELVLLASQKYTDQAKDGLQQQISAQAVYNAEQTATMRCLNQQIQDLKSITQLVVPNRNVSPGWGPAFVGPMPVQYVPVPITGSGTSGGTDAATTTPTTGG